MNRKLVANDNIGSREYPHPSDASYDNNQRSNRMDLFCLGCHNPPSGSVALHTWEDLAGGVRAPSDTHPSDAAPAPDARFRKPAVLPLSEYMAYRTTPPTTATNAGNVACITCHEPHVPNNGIDNADAQMAREGWKTGSTLCVRCHL